MSSLNARESLSRFTELCAKERVLDELGSAIFPSDTVYSIGKRIRERGHELEWALGPSEAQVTITMMGTRKRAKVIETLTIPVAGLDGQGKVFSERIGTVVAAVFREASSRFHEDALNVEMETDPYGYSPEDLTGW
jgi:hypothetical protein